MCVGNHAAGIRFGTVSEICVYVLTCRHWLGRALCDLQLVLVRGCQTCGGNVKSPEITVVFRKPVMLAEK